MSTLRKKPSLLERANRLAERLSEPDLRAHSAYCQELLKRLQAERERALAAADLTEAQREALRRGKGVRQVRYIRCGKAGCTCARGRGHGPYVYLVFWDPVSKAMRSRYMGKA